MKMKNYFSKLMALALTMLCTNMVSGRNSNRTGMANSTPDSVINTILTRTSVRSYLNKTVEKEKIEQLLRAGMAAPSAVNRQPWHFIVVTDKKMLAAIADATPNAGMAAQAPLAILVCGDMNKALDGGARDFWIQDASAATENILIAAHALGLGAVWTGTYPSQDRCAKIEKLMKMPQNIVPLNTIVIGYPAESPQPKDKWKTENISYNVYGGNEDGTVVVPAKKEKTFQEFDVEKGFRENAFTFFHGNDGHGILLATGDKNGSNAMTIGWGALGTLWGHNDAVTVYVAEKRFSKHLMDKGEYFTVMTFDKEHASILDYMGSHSGRDGDKAKALGLHVLYTEHGAPYYAEAQEVIECKMMYAAPFSASGFRDIPKQLYSHFSAGVHSVYIGKIVKAMKKQ
jgi:nitroreductase/flavin reductase (DIM6/NTAB) family NADH-FMN oxidoreductase RutF